MRHQREKEREKEKEKEKKYSSRIEKDDSQKKKPILLNAKKRYSSPSNKNKLNLKKSQINFSSAIYQADNEYTINNEGQRGSNPNITKITQCGRKPRKSCYNNKDMKKTFLSLKYKNLNLNKRRSSSNSNFKMSIKIKDKNYKRNSIFEDPP